MPSTLFSFTSARTAQAAEAVLCTCGRKGLGRTMALVPSEPSSADSLPVSAAGARRGDVGRSEQLCLRVKPSCIGGRDPIATHSRASFDGAAEGSL